MRSLLASKGRTRAFALVAGPGVVALLITLCAGEMEDMEAVLGKESERSAAGYLQIVQKKEGELTDREARMRRNLSMMKVSTIDDAKRIAMEYALKDRGILARERAEVVGLVRVARDVSTFAKRGDFVWIVRFIHLGGGRSEVIEGVTQELWIGARSAEVRAIFPSK